MDKFLIADNPMRDDSGAWIIHLLSPQAHIQCLEGHAQTDKIHKHYTYKNSDGAIEGWTLSAQFFFTTDFISEPEKQVIPLLDRAWRWYRSYLELEDKNIDDAEETNEN
jgi:hypothetical protein